MIFCKVFMAIGRETAMQEFLQRKPIQFLIFLIYWVYYLHVSIFHNASPITALTYYKPSFHRLRIIFLILRSIICGCITLFFFFSFSFCSIYKRGRFVVIACAILFCQRLETFRSLSGVSSHRCFGRPFGR